MVTLGIRIMANLPDLKDDQSRVDHGGQSGHFYLAVTTIVRIISIMLNNGYRRPSAAAASGGFSPRGSLDFRAKSAGTSYAKT